MDINLTAVVSELRNEKNGRREPLPYENMSTADLPGEEWRLVAGYGDLYSVSNLGRVRKNAVNPDELNGRPANRSHPFKRLGFGRRFGHVKQTKAKMLKQFTSKADTPDALVLYVSLSDNGAWRSVPVRALVGRAFRGECPPGKYYRNLYPRDNRLCNIVAMTKGESIQYAHKTGRKSVPRALQQRHETYKEQHLIYKEGMLAAKICTKCKSEKPLEAYKERRKNKDAPLRPMSICRDCVNSYQRDWERRQRPAEEDATNTKETL